MTANNNQERTISPGATRGRGEFFTLIHALRGMAALWVMLFHLDKTTAFARALNQLPDSVRYALFGYGSAGVAMFFVVSGFVIAHSLAGKEMTPTAFGQFVVRRSVRLDPAYWASMVLAIVVGILAHRQFTAGQIGLHMLYLQTLTHVSPIQLVYWTLVYEIQFYLVLATALVAVYRYPALKKPLWAALYLLALWSAVHPGDWAPEGLFVLLWHAFMAGLCAYYAGLRGGSPLPLLVLLGAMAYGSTLTGSVFNAPAAATAALLFIAARTGRLSVPIPAWIAMSGTLSYSLYLVHGPVLEVCSALWRRIDGPPLATWIAVTGTLAAGLLGAAALYSAVERPSHRLAKRLFNAPMRPVSGFAA